eukprot:TRINITY_DN5532_c0_g1_i7.p2 TRINITY_DN5532_c0_g1~~TRINITY_DN5532_c0_g1_i7.p2  ORF type:complete len:251 (-),score=21.95 TRINITY_DN5532_c0_g1_i7:178-930(-)
MAGVACQQSHTHLNRVPPWLPRQMRMELIFGPSDRPDERTGFILFEDLARALSNLPADVVYMLNCCAAQPLFRGNQVYSHCVIGACSGDASLPAAGFGPYLAKALEDGEGRLAAELPALLLNAYTASTDTDFHSLHPVFMSLFGHELGAYLAPVTAHPDPYDGTEASMPWDVLCNLSGVTDKEQASKFLDKLAEVLAAGGTRLQLAEGWASQRGTFVRLGVLGPDKQALACLANEGFARAVAVKPRESDS